MASKSKRKPESSLSAEIPAIPAKILDGRGVPRNTHLTKKQRDAAVEAYDTPGSSWSNTFREKRHAERVYEYLTNSDNGFDSSRITLSKDKKSIGISGPPAGELNAFRTPKEGMPTQKEQLERANTSAEKLIFALQDADLHREAAYISVFRKEGWSKDGEITLPFSFFSQARKIQGFFESAGFRNKIILTTPRDRLRKDELTLMVLGNETRDISQFNPLPRKIPTVARFAAAVPKKRVPRPLPLTKSEYTALNKLWKLSTKTVADKIDLLESSASALGNDSSKEDLKSFLRQYSGLYDLMKKGGPESASIDKALREFAPMRSAVRKKLTGKENVLFPELTAPGTLASK